MLHQRFERLHFPLKFIQTGIKESSETSNQAEYDIKHTAIDILRNIVNKACVRIFAFTPIMRTVPTEAKIGSEAWRRPAVNIVT